MGFIDPVMATAELIQNLNTIVSRRINIVNNPAVISVGIVRSGTREILFPKIPKYREQLEPLIQSSEQKYTRNRTSSVWCCFGTGTEVSVEFDVGGFYPVTFR